MFDFDLDAISLSQDNRFAFINSDGDSDFFSVDLQNVDTAGGSHHITPFNFSSQRWSHGGMVVLGNNLYAAANGGGSFKRENPDFRGSTVQLFRMPIDPSTGNLGSPQLYTNIDDQQGNVATSNNVRLAADSESVYASDPNSALVFQIGVFNSCILSGNNLIRVNSVTGEYQLQSCGGTSLTGTGTIVPFGPCNFVLFNFGGGQFIKAAFNTCTQTGGGGAGPGIGFFSGPQVPAPSCKCPGQ
ncbi:MAG: hypothetical protein PHX83_05840 [Acidobacteriia bacterium]|nr:hypothetical protein [Terriglobia bacterium]